MEYLLFNNIEFYHTPISSFELPIMQWYGLFYFLFEYICRNTIIMQHVLVVGGFGFLGRYIAAELLSQQFRVTVSDIRSDFPGFAPEIQAITHDFGMAPESESILLLKHFDVVVFCGGRDDRSLPDGDAWDFFYKANVVATLQLTRLSSEAGVKKLVIMGSYFAYFNRIMPQMQLTKHHPYVRSRVEQEKQCIAAAEGGLQVIVLEIPYVFGALQGVVPLWKSLVRYINKTPIVFYTTGGTAFISVRNLAQAVAGSILYAKHGDCIPVAGKNMTWKEMIKLIAKALDKKKPVISLTWWMIQPLTLFLKLHFKLKGVQSGLDPYYFIRMQCKKTYIDTEFCSSYLHFEPENLDWVFADTVEACMK